MTTDLISVPSFVPEYLGSFGIDMREVLRQAGLSPMLFHGGKTRITTRDFFALWNAIEKVGAPADFGLRVGMADPPPGQYDVATMAALLSEVLALEQFEKGRGRVLDAVVYGFPPRDLAFAYPCGHLSLELGHEIEIVRDVEPLQPKALAHDEHDVTGSVGQPRGVVLRDQI